VKHRRRREPRKKPPVGRIHYMHRNGVERWDEIKEPLETDPDLRTISYLKPNEIRVELPIDFLIFWEVAPWDGDQLTHPIIKNEPQRRPRPDELDWPVNVKY